MIKTVVVQLPGNYVEPEYVVDYEWNQRGMPTIQLRGIFTRKRWVQFKDNPHPWRNDVQILWLRERCITPVAQPREFVIPKYLMEPAMFLARNGRTVDGVKLLRNGTFAHGEDMGEFIASNTPNPIKGLGLKDAKDIIDKLKHVEHFVAGTKY